MRFVGWTLFFLVLAPALVFSCSLRPIEYVQVSTDLSVYISHLEKPIGGIEVTVVPEGHDVPVLEFRSNEKGIVELHSLAVGKYKLQASHAGVEAGYEWIEVLATPRKKNLKRRIDFEWGYSSFQVSEVKGSLTGLTFGNSGNKIMDVVHPREIPHPGVPLSLRSAFTDVKYRTVSDSTGQFMFGAVPEGLYVLEITGGAESMFGAAQDTNLVIDLDPASKQAELPLRLQDLGCGRIGYRPEKAA
jgi:hypothetical protein